MSLCWDVKDSVKEGLLNSPEVPQKSCYGKPGIFQAGRQAGYLLLRGRLGLHNKFQASQNYLQEICLQTNKTAKEGNKREKERNAM